MDSYISRTLICETMLLQLSMFHKIPKKRKEKKEFSIQTPQLQIQTQGWFLHTCLSTHSPYSLWTHQWANPKPITGSHFKGSRSGGPQSKPKQNTVGSTFLIDRFVCEMRILTAWIAASIIESQACLTRTRGANSTQTEWPTSQIFMWDYNLSHARASL